jgi:2-iminobutanoate/2-iminopropanoate deaminase
MPRKTYQPEKGGLDAPLSMAVRGGDNVYLSGHVAFDENGEIVGNTITEQTHQTFKNCISTLELAGITMGDVVKVNVYLTDVNNFAAMNKVYKEYFPTMPPARTTVGTPLGQLGLLIEIEMIVYAPE